MIRKLPRRFVEKIWGVDRLPPPFPHPSEDRIGEVWFDPPEELPQLLVKYIFTSERLSVQAHPDDDQAEAMGYGRAGKSECWVILDAEPGATIAVGFHREITPEVLREAALDGSIVEHLVWHEVEAGDAFYIPAGTVHAIGGGVSLIEVQQNSDLTFRLFDYGRPRELHLDEGLQIADVGSYPNSLRRNLSGKGQLLVDGPHFRLFHARGMHHPEGLESGPALVIPFSSEVLLGEESLECGECALVSDVTKVALGGTGIALIAQPSR
ncbi:class I mannose-6-phosphate isomerase [Qipengyuania sp. XHP0211]|uniref:class I mannose-6-phosphate isomerase n=1 Tax=Qipengyuania sp. XHP0211 TaxID=3038079 RepID=UPI00241D1850|nr:class I mannose-6-phosphate isomerase [Qipengyuania sp. XHP0211]MDG5750978.1 class I mannose-6-phosphate isomerase [Qipengyuania sp. XHP0211]